MRPFGLRISIDDEKKKIEIGVAVGAARIPERSEIFNFLAGFQNPDSRLDRPRHGAMPQASRSRLPTRDQACPGSGHLPRWGRIANTSRREVFRGDKKFRKVYCGERGRTIAGRRLSWMTAPVRMFTLCVKIVLGFKSLGVAVFLP